ncbi:SsrA-binding protein [Candidatus Shapirobacteria bacterium CG10_big_fil_rev_8_21_14_0_10_40_9]|uniref:SsrA-binding protein n=1 Tax=Candidatus Shapirobacteria bacterium CG10_big_fil_rev_8_21_14_0_10_40_9 TaxID=1974888 RepID=A0A2M8L2R6_9BACT|nr:MAG: SsrA-binding protein [Candidatus Shapirobacteria bacterium CG10_big_fil_rev_8_21_14_0_10_40_9]
MKVLNRRASHDYQLLEKFEAGIALSGPEVKSVREGKISLEGSFARIAGGEAWLFNCHIHPYRFADTRDLDPSRSRKILLHKKEIISLESKMRQKRLTLVPLACYTKGRLIKLELALGRGKKEYEKKEAKKRRDIEREVERQLAGSE